jgi:hypothetical protein
MKFLTITPPILAKIEYQFNDRGQVLVESSKWGPFALLNGNDVDSPDKAFVGSCIVLGRGDGYQGSGLSANHILRDVIWEDDLCDGFYQGRLVMVGLSEHDFGKVASLGEKMPSQSPRFTNGLGSWSIMIHACGKWRWIAW